MPKPSILGIKKLYQVSIEAWVEVEAGDPEKIYDAADDSLMKMNKVIHLLNQLGIEWEWQQPTEVR